MNLQGQFWTPRPLHRAWGHRLVEALPTPAAGAGFTITLEPQFLWLLNGVTLTIVASAQAGERRLALQLVNGNGLVYATTPLSNFLSATATCVIYFGTSVSVVAENTSARQTVQLPSVIQQRGSTVELVTSGLQTEDQISKIVVDAEAFEEDPQHDLAEIEGMALRIRELERKVAESALPVHQ